MAREAFLSQVFYNEVGKRGKRFVLKEYITSSSYGVSKGMSSSSRFFKEIAVSS